MSSEQQQQQQVPQAEERAEDFFDEDNCFVIRFVDEEAQGIVNDKGRGDFEWNLEMDPVELTLRGVTEVVTSRGLFSPSLIVGEAPNQLEGRRKLPASLPCIMILNSTEVEVAERQTGRDLPGEYTKIGEVPYIVLVGSSYPSLENYLDKHTILVEWYPERPVVGADHNSGVGGSGESGTSSGSGGKKALMLKRKFLEKPQATGTGAAEAERAMKLKREKLEKDILARRKVSPPLPSARGGAVPGSGRTKSAQHRDQNVPPTALSAEEKLRQEIRPPTAAEMGVDVDQRGGDYLLPPNPKRMKEVLEMRDKDLKTMVESYSIVPMLAVKDGSSKYTFEHAELIPKDEFVSEKHEEVSSDEDE